MQAYTEEQRAELIEHAKSWIADSEAMRDEIPFGFDVDTEKELSLIKIALTALTAPDDWKQRAEAAEAESARLTRNYKHIIDQHMPRTSDGCDKGWTRVIEARELQAKLEAAEARANNLNDGWLNAIAERDEARAKLAALEKQAKDQKPFMYGIMTANGDAHFEDFCVSSDPSLLEDVIWEWNNSLADNEPKSRVVALYTRPTHHE